MTGFDPDAVTPLAALEGTGTGAWEWDVARNEVRWSPNLGPLHGLPRGFSPDGYSGFMAVVHPEHREEMAAAVAAAVDQGRDYELDFRTRWPDGTVRWLSTRGHVLRAADGAVAKVVGVVSDVTERRRREEQLRLIGRAGEVLGSSLDYRETVQRVADLLVPHLSDWCAVHLIDDGEIASLAVAHSDPAMLALAAGLEEEYPPDLGRPGPLRDVFETGRPFVLEDIADEMLAAGARDERHLELLRTIGMRSVVMVPLRARGRILGVVTLVAAESGIRFTADDVAFAQSLAGRAALAIDNARLFREAETARRDVEAGAARLHLLQDVIADLSRSLDVRSAAQIGLRRGAAALGANRATVVLASWPDGEIELVEAMGYSSDRWSQFDADALAMPGPLRESFLTGRAVYCESVHELLERYPELRSYMSTVSAGAFAAVPLVAPEGMSGVIGVVHDTDRAFPAAERDMLWALAQHVGLAIERARLFEQAQTVARSLQHALAPPQDLARPGVRAAARYKPAGVVDVGGDWYDVVDTPRGTHVYVVGDVVGRGVPAVASMAQLRHSLRMLLFDGKAPGAALEALNRLARTEWGALCATVACVEIDTTAGLLRVASAGHLPVVVRRAGSSELLRAPQSPPLGVSDRAVEEVAFPVAAGDLAVLYTDGLIEARHPDLEEGLLALLARFESLGDDPGDVADGLIGLAGGLSEDDVTVLAIQFA